MYPPHDPQIFIMHPTGEWLPYRQRIGKVESGITVKVDPDRDRALYCKP